MKKAKVYTLPKDYIERQRIIKALQIPFLELVLWYYYESENGKNMYLWGVYLDKNNTLRVYFYDIETLQRIGRGFIRGETPNTEREPNINDLYKWVHRKGGITDLFGYVIGVQSRPPKSEGKIIQFPVIKAKRRNETATAIKGELT
jgi:hypothetical protein